MTTIFKDIDDRTLRTWYLNARTTHYRALGHGKASRNEDAMRRYEQLMRDRGMVVPPMDETGVFNGEGSS